jgi:hypothetical protein
VNEGGTVEFTVSRTTPTAVNTVVKARQGDVMIKAGETSANLQGATQDNTTYDPNPDVVVTQAAEFGGASVKGQVPDSEQPQLNAPSILRVMDDVSPITGPAAANGITNDRAPTVRINVTSTGAVAGDKVQLFNGATVPGEAVVLTADITNGVVTITPATLRDGTYTLNATVSAAAGNTSSASANYQVTVKAPVASVAVATFLAVAADSLTADVPSSSTVASNPVTSPTINNVEQQGSTSRLTATSERLSTVRIQDGGGLTGLANADAAGHRSLPVSFRDAVHTLLVSATTSSGAVATSAGTTLLGSLRSGALEDGLLIGSEGNDALAGGLGHDTFVFHKGFGKDGVFDFTPEQDKVAFEQENFSSIDQVMAAAAQGRNQVAVTINENNSLTLKSVTIAQLHNHPDRFFI